MSHHHTALDDCEPKSDGYKPSVLSDLLDLLEFAEGALIDSISCEDGLDGNTGLRVLKMISDELIKHGRLSSFTQIPKEEV